MPEFHLDTSGRIECADPHKPCVCHAATWAQLAEGPRGYIEAMFFTDTEIGKDRESCNPETDSHLPGDVAFSDLAPETLQHVLDDWAAFEAKARDLLKLAEERGYSEEQAGRDFWYTRNGHGVGFWDRRELEPDSDEYERLTAEIVAAGDHSDARNAALAKRNALKSEGLGERLSAIAEEFGSVDSYLGDDGKVYLS